MRDKALNLIFCFNRITPPGTPCLWKKRIEKLAKQNNCSMLDTQGSSNDVKDFMFQAVFVLDRRTLKFL